MTTTLLREKKKRGLKSLVNQFEFQTTVVKSKRAVQVESSVALQTISLTDSLNRMVRGGIAFDISAENFHFARKGSEAAQEDIEFLKTNAPVVLCYLQQMLLSRDIFGPEPQLLEDFKVEIQEREALATDGSATIPTDIHTRAVVETTKSWFADVYRKIL